eukprot:3572521-Rhodomonas_salina.2
MGSVSIAAGLSPLLAETHPRGLRLERGRAAGRPWQHTTDESEEPDCRGPGWRTDSRLRFLSSSSESPAVIRRMLIIDASLHPPDTRLRVPVSALWRARCILVVAVTSSSSSSSSSSS